jgi:hypothetical protein
MKIYAIEPPESKIGFKSVVVMTDDELKKMIEEGHYQAELILDTDDLKIDSEIGDEDV